jgi:hypothetical protein
VAGIGASSATKKEERPTMTQVEKAITRSEQHDEIRPTVMYYATTAPESYDHWYTKTAGEITSVSGVKYRVVCTDDLKRFAYFQVPRYSSGFYALERLNSSIFAVEDLERFQDARISGVSSATKKDQNHDRLKHQDH